MHLYFTYEEAIALVGKKVKRVPDDMKGAVVHVDADISRAKAQTLRCFMVRILWDDVMISYPYDVQRFVDMVRLN